MHADVAVIGLGAMGCASLYHLAKAGVKVLGFEQFQVGHDRGSSHGETRLIRQAYFEHPDYVPLLLEAYRLWDELCAESGNELFHKNGLVIFGKEKESTIIQGVLRSAALHKIKIEKYNSGECRRVFPDYNIPSDCIGVYEPTGGYLEVENCNLAHAELAAKAGAQLLQGDAVKSVVADKNAVKITTAKRTYEVKKAIVTAGAWSSGLLKSFGLPLKVHRVVMGWYPCSETYGSKYKLPCFGAHFDGHFFYGFPKISNLGMKIAEHLPGEVVTQPEKLKRECTDQDFKNVSKFIPNFFKGVKNIPSHSMACMYTMTPDEHFIVDRAENSEHLYFAAGFSGHGFKFAPVIGKALCDLALSGKTKLPIEFLRRRDRHS
jgi:sarcosine oxidase